MQRGDKPRNSFGAVSYTHLDVYKRQVALGTVAAADPLRVRLSQKLTLGPGQLILTQRAAGLELLPGDTVAVLRAQDCLLYTSRCV